MTTPPPAPDNLLAKRTQSKLSDQIHEVVLTIIVQGRYPEGAKLPTKIAWRGCSPSSARSCARP